jgi:hypothetical protein
MVAPPKRFAFEHVSSKALRIPTAINLQSFLPPSFHGPTRTQTGFISFLSNRRRGPFLKKCRKGAKKPRQKEENQIRREIGNEIFFTKNKRMKGK